MVTLEQLQSLGWGAEIHYVGLNGRGTAYQECRKEVGPRGGVKIHIIRVRPNGALKTWKTRPGEFRLPVKYGLREYSEITHRNAGDWHLAEDCPIRD